MLNVLLGVGIYSRVPWSVSVNDGEFDRDVIMNGYDSDYDVFGSQPTLTNTFEVHINSDFETLLNSDLDSLPNSCIGKCELTDFKDFSSGSDTNLYNLSPNTQFNLLNSLPCTPRLQTSSLRIPQRFSNSEQNVDSSSAKMDQPEPDLGDKKLCDSAYSVNTENKCKWALGVYQRWVKERRHNGRKEDVELNPDIVSLAQKERELNKNLMFFITEVRNQKGEEYHGKTIYEIVSSLQIHIRSNGTPLNIFESPLFHGLRCVLGIKMKSLAKLGIATEKRQARVISEDQEDVLWEKEILGESTPQHLLDTMVYLIGCNCALRSGDDHRSLRTGPSSQFEITVDEDGSKRLKYKEHAFKAHKVTRGKCEEKFFSISQDFEHPERCLVRLYEKYMSLRPKDGKCSAFYLRPLKFISENTWYADTPVGLHPLRGTVGRLCKTAGFTGFYSNHSLRATSATTATQLCDYDEQVIVENTRHTSLAIRNLKRNSTDMEARADGVIQWKSTASETASTSTTSSAMASADDIVDDTASWKNAITNWF